MYCNFVNTLFSRHERGASMTGLAIGCIKARDEISEVVVFFSSSSSCSSSSGEDKTFRTRLLDTFVLVFLNSPHPVDTEVKTTWKDWSLMSLSPWLSDVNYWKPFIVLWEAIRRRQPDINSPEVYGEAHFVDDTVPVQQPDSVWASPASLSLHLLRWFDDAECLSSSLVPAAFSNQFAIHNMNMWPYINQGSVQQNVCIWYLHIFKTYLRGQHIILYVLTWINVCGQTWCPCRSRQVYLKNEKTGVPAGRTCMDDVYT